MQKQSTFQQDLLQSQVQFRAQFDPQSQHHHKGITLPVPLNGQRIPTSMPSQFPQGYNPNEQPIQQVIDYGQNYRKVQKDRAVYQNVKKSLARLCPVVQAFLRHNQLFKDKADNNNQKHVKAHQDTIAKEMVNLHQAQQQLKLLIPQLDAIDVEGAEMAKDLISIIQDSSKTYDNKESLTDFNFKAKRVSAKSFADAQKCLQKLKDIKKNHKKVETTA